MNFVYCLYCVNFADNVYSSSNHGYTPLVSRGLQTDMWRGIRESIYSSNSFNCYRIVGNHQMYEVFNDTAAQVILAIESGDSIRHVAQHLHTPYETVRQAVSRLEGAGYVCYDDGLAVVDDRVRDAARELVAASAGVSPPSIEETYVIPQFGDWPFAFTRIDAVYVWTQGGYQVSRDPEDYPLFLDVREQDVDAWEAFFESFGLRLRSSASLRRNLQDRCRSSSSLSRRSASSTSKDTQ